MTETPEQINNRVLFEQEIAELRRYRYYTIQECHKMLDRIFIRELRKKIKQN